MVKKLYDFTKQYNRMIIRIKETNILTTEEKKLILKFDDSLINQRTSEARRENLLMKLLIMRKKYLDTPYNKPNKESIERFCKLVNADKKIRERSRGDFKAILKQFYRWHNDGTLPPYVAWIRRKQLLDERQLQEKTKEDLLEPEEQKALLKATTTKRDYAIIKLALETGMRPAELLRLKVKHIDFGTKKKNDITMLTIPSDNKTGSRKIPIVASVKALIDYLNNDHPYNNDPNAWLWLQKRRYRNQPLTYKGYSDFLRILKDVAKIKKRFHAYIFRYSSYTNKARAGWSEQKIKAYHGLAKDSKMLAVYVKMDAEDLIDDVLELSGRKVIRRTKQNKVFIECPRCKEENDSNKKFCVKCGMILDLEEAQKQVDDKDKEQKVKDSELSELKAQMNEIQKQMLKMLKNKYK